MNNLKLKGLILCVVALLTSCTQAQETLRLWPNGAPHKSGLSGEESENSNGLLSNVTKPEMIVYRASQPTGKAVVCCPGGGYALLSMKEEGRDWAQWFNNQGVTFILLKYRMPNGHKEVPMEDVTQTMRLMRQHASEWNVNPNDIGIMGFSAGGHLASWMATHFDETTRPAFQILFYPVITMGVSTNGGSLRNLLGQAPTQEEKDEFSNELQVKSGTPPAYILFCSDDRAVPVVNSLSYYQALQSKGIAAELHAYPKGGHGFGFRDTYFKKEWQESLAQWLKAVTK